uniref:Uncharacterized protein n=1 Tax=Anguilla anguilla TaxID=7936 RepID=A0A0E9SIA0_ANGAN
MLLFNTLDWIQTLIQVLLYFVTAQTVVSLMFSTTERHSG